MSSGSQSAGSAPSAMFEAIRSDSNVTFALRMSRNRSAMWSLAGVTPTAELMIRQPPGQDVSV